MKLEMSLKPDSRAMENARVRSGKRWLDQFTRAHELDLEHVREAVTGSEMKVLRGFCCIAVIAFVTSCADAIGCDPCFTSAVANVFVRDSADLPVAGVPVELRTYLRVCGLDLRGGEGPMVTGADGHRRILMSSLFSPHTARCVVVTVNPESDPAQPIGRAEFPTNVEFRAEDGSPRDSVRLDVVVSRNGN